MIRLLGSFFLCCIRSTEESRRAYSTRQLINLLKADTSGQMIAMSRRIDLLARDHAELSKRLDRLEHKRGKRG